MSTFLEAAVAYIDNTPQPEALTIVTPNRRMAMYVKEHLRRRAKAADKITMMPRIMTLDTLIERLAPFPRATDTELLMLLYRSYCKVMLEHDANPVPFDRFVFWGDIVLGDFDAVDASMANADALFNNLVNIKEIQSTYLDSEQLEVVRRIWGDNAVADYDGTFWTHIPHSDDNDTPHTLANEFIRLWQILGSVYQVYHDELAKNQISSPGLQAKAAANAIDKLPEQYNRQYVFVGFDTLSVAEIMLMKRLRKRNLASFLWDTSPMTLPGGDAAAARAIRRVQKLADELPSPSDFRLDAPSRRPSIEVVAIPSAIGQAKALGNILQQWADKGHIDKVSPMSTAVVLPDATQLMPVLFSIPQSIPSVNISLGLPYRSTNFAVLLRAIVSMQTRARNIHGTTHFYFEDVSAILLHPHIQAIAPAEAQALRQRIERDRIYNLSVTMISETAPELTPIFTPVQGLSDPTAVSAYLLNMLHWLGTRINEKGGGEFELKAISFFSKQIEAIERLIVKYRISMSDRTMLHLFERLFSRRALSVNGTPLRGLQVLGVLETRGLDFDNVAVLSMNEGTFPRRNYTKTMIPASLRGAYGLPELDALEASYAYCFYRLLSRARRVALIYDSRAESLGGGEVSRYVRQIQHLMPGLDISFTTLMPEAVPADDATITVPKTANVLRRLDRLRPGGDARLSATALKAYRQCPLRFYLQYAAGMRGSDELVDYISASDYGTIVHESIQALFEPRKHQPIDAQYIDTLLDPANNAIPLAIRGTVVAQCYPQYATGGNVFNTPLPPEGELCCEIVDRIVRSDLRAEAAAYCHPDFIFRANEDRYSSPPWHVAEGLDVNFYMSIDRVDSVDARTLRFVDFKTGTEATSASLDDLFDGSVTDADGIFQLLIYCQAYADMVDSTIDTVPMLHPMKDLAREPVLRPIEVDGIVVDRYKAVEHLFRPRLQAMIREIFDPEVPFRQCDNARQCAFCPFLSMCGRVVPAY